FSRGRDRALSYSSLQSTPMLSRSGAFIGVISTHHGYIHHPSEKELHELLNIGRAAADAVIRHRALSPGRTLNMVCPSLGRWPGGFSLSGAALERWRYQRRRSYLHSSACAFKNRTKSDLPGLSSKRSIAISSSFGVKRRSISAPELGRDAGFRPRVHPTLSFGIAIARSIDRHGVQAEQFPKPPYKTQWAITRCRTCIFYGRN